MIYPCVYCLNDFLLKHCGRLPLKPFSRTDEAPVHDFATQDSSGHVGAKLHRGSQKCISPGANFDAGDLVKLSTKNGRLVSFHPIYSPVIANRSWIT